MRKTKLNEHLLDADDDPEAGARPPSASASASSSDESEAVGRAIERFRLDYPAETREEKAIRLSIQDRADKQIISAFGMVVSISVLSSLAGMWFFPLGIFDLLFYVSIVQGPLVIYQRYRLIRSKVQREVIATLWSETKSLNQAIGSMGADINKKQVDIERLTSQLGRHKDLMEGYDFSDITDLYQENKRINREKKFLAEAMGLQNLVKGILTTDVNRDHHVGDAELKLLAQRVSLNEGVPFTSEELCDRFKLQETHNLRILADVVRTLYIEKRQGQMTAKEAEESDRSPRKLGAPLLWKRQIDGIGVVV